MPQKFDDISQKFFSLELDLPYSLTQIFCIVLSKMPPPNLSELHLILDGYFPRWMSIRRALCVLNGLARAWPLMRHHQIQRERFPHQDATGWLTSLRSYVSDMLAPEDWPRTGIDWDNDLLAPPLAQRGAFLTDLPDIYAVLEADDTVQELQDFGLPAPHLLVTRVERCLFCNTDGRAPVLLKLDESMVNVLGPTYQYSQARLVVAHCRKCKAHYFPDCVTFLQAEIDAEEPAAGGRRRRRRRRRLQKLFADPVWIRISKQNLWAHRNVAIMQENIMRDLKGTWMRFHQFFNRTYGKGVEIITARQVYKLYVEHFSRVLLQSHEEIDAFSCIAMCEPDLMVKSVLQIVGVGGGTVAGSETHRCAECAHPKRYREPGNQLDPNNPRRFGVVEMEDVPPNDIEVNQEEFPQPPNLEPEEEVEGDEELIVRAAVMDGKTISHKICRIEDCRNPLENFKNGIFCREHRNYNNICGIGTCNRPREEGSMACNLANHQRWYREYQQRFGRLTYGSVTRIIRRTTDAERARVYGEQHQMNAAQNDVLNFPMRPQLPTGPDGKDGGAVEHRFRAGSTYCVQTVQWACGMPVGWGKCYKSESVSQVLAIIKNVFSEEQPENRPSFLFYDNACKLLAHITAQGEWIWLDTTRFVVDSWHYINHRVSDGLCRIWCNPAPMDGSQPDLVITEVDEDGVRRARRAFNTQTAEQFNSWVNSFEAALRQMSDFNFDFTMHVIFHLYASICTEHQDD